MSYRPADWASLILLVWFKNSNKRLAVWRWCSSTTRGQQKVSPSSLIQGYHLGLTGLWVSVFITLMLELTGGDPQPPHRRSVLSFKNVLQSGIFVSMTTVIGHCLLTVESVVENAEPAGAQVCYLRLLGGWLLCCVARLVAGHSSPPRMQLHANASSSSGWCWRCC